MGYLETEPAEVFLDQFRQLIESEARAVANLIHPAEWLWWIRRLPDDIFAGQLASTGVYDRSLAAVLSAGSNKAALSASFRPPHPRGYVTEGTLSTVLDLAALAVIASQSHVLLRYVGKGARLEVREGEFPEVRPDPRISASIRRFDSRMERSHHASLEFNFFGPAGTRTLTGVTNRDDPTVMLTAVPASRELVDTTFGSALLGQVEVPVKVWAEYRAVLVSAEQLATLTGEPALLGAMWWEDALPSLLVFLRTMWLAVPYMTGGLPGLYRTGYTVADPQRLRDLLGRAVTEVSSAVEAVLPGARIGGADEVWDQVLGLKGESWPLAPGPVLRRAGHLVLVDLASAGERLRRMLNISPSGGGSLANVRGRHFEIVVQEIIDRSQWKPAPGLAALRGRTLRACNGSAVTDIDAVGEYDRTLLLVNAKSYPLTSLYDAGQYGAVQNVAQRVVEDCESWTRKLEIFRANPRGKNYDFQEYREIIGVVCTPFPCWVPAGSATLPVAAGLYAASSAAELERWLHCMAS